MLQRTVNELRQDLSIREDLGKGAATRIASQQRELREAQQRMDALEVQMTELAAAIEEERQAMQLRLDESRQEAVQHISKLQDALSIRWGSRIPRCPHALPVSLSPFLPCPALP